MGGGGGEVWREVWREVWGGAMRCGAAQCGGEAVRCHGKLRSLGAKLCQAHSLRRGRWMDC